MNRTRHKIKETNLMYFEIPHYIYNHSVHTTQITTCYYHSNITVFISHTDFKILLLKYVRSLSVEVQM